MYGINSVSHQLEEESGEECEDPHDDVGKKKKKKKRKRNKNKKANNNAVD